MLSLQLISTMRFHLISFLTVAAATFTAASPNYQPLQAAPHHTSPRPDVKYHPKTPRRSPPYHSQRTNLTCYVQSHGNGTDDSSYILSAVNTCNNGGHVVFTQGTKYTIGTALNLTFLEHIDIDIQGYIQFTNDTVYWQANSFKLIFQNVTTFWNFGGEDVNIYGTSFAHFP